MPARTRDENQLGLFMDKPARLTLSKSKYVTGTQCHRLLWWTVHEPMAVELQPDKVLQDRFDQGAQVGALARHEFGEGAAFEKTFEADGVSVRVDVLAPDGDGFRLIEVKSTSSAKPEHIPDVAVQLHVLEKNGVDVRAVDVMHLNKECRHPDLSNLLMKTDVTTEARAMLPIVPGEAQAQLEMLKGPLPDRAIGVHCYEPRDCAFLERCWPKDADHIAKLYSVGPKKAADYMAAGVHKFSDIPPKRKLPPAAQRQIRALNENRLIVEPGLAQALQDFRGRLGFLDFETIQRAVPVWPGTNPWEQSAAQFSYHEAQPDGSYTHAAFLAEGAEDARPPLARAMIEATRNADKVVTYSGFEKTRIRSLQQTVPELRDELVELEGKLIDLLPVIRENVYHPEFHGSFSIKYVLTPLVPELTYNDLVIVNGLVASVEIARLLFVAQRIPPDERARVRQDLLDYCERDTWAMVKLVERLRELAALHR